MVIFKTALLVLHTRLPLGLLNNSFNICHSVIAVAKHATRSLFAKCERHSAAKKAV